MPVKVDKELLQKPYFWAVCVPALLLVWMIPVAFALGDARDKALRDVKDTAKVEEHSRTVLSHLKRSGKLGFEGDIGKEFDGIKAARQCAWNAKISESRLVRLESSKIKSLKSDRLLHRETYQLSNVKLLQIALFIDYAEQTYLNVSCHDLSMIFVKGKSKDLWEATVYVAYLEKEES